VGSSNNVAADVAAVAPANPPAVGEPDCLREGKPDPGCPKPSQTAANRPVRVSLYAVMISPEFSRAKFRNATECLNTAEYTHTPRELCGTMPGEANAAAR
jgi:hypothetical protein